MYDKIHYKKNKTKTKNSSIIFDKGAKTSVGA